MKIEVVRTKIHRVKVTGAELDYIGSITIDADLMDAAKMIVGEKVQIVNIQTVLVLRLIHTRQKRFRRNHSEWAGSSFGSKG